jgi:uncharacterized protein
MAALASLSLASSTLAAGAAPATLPPDLPALAQPPGEQLVGKVIWHDLVTPDLQAAKQFYSELFGWTFHDLSPDYSVAYLNGEAVGGLFRRPQAAGKRRQPLWLTFIAVANAASAVQTAQRNGARILVQPRSYPNRGEQAVIADPEGAVFAVLASSSGDPPDYLASPGAWIWSVLLVHDPDRAAAFYQKLFDYEVFDASESGPQRLILSSQDYARASVNTLPPAAVRGRPHWLGFVRVQDAAAAAAKAAALGGRVLVPPRTDRQGGKLAVIADPAGAPLGVMEWTPGSGAGAQEPR